MRHFPITRLLILGTVCLLSGCASDVPLVIRQAPAETVTLEQARQNPARAERARVRWGGEIVAVDNQSQSTLVEIFAKPLNDEGKPQGDQGDGRFIARFPGFLDPVRYAKERLLTVTGTLAKGMRKKIGDYSYAYPVVDVTAHYLWPKPVNYPPPSYLWDPFPYDPWWPYYRLPYRYPYWY